jgi:threonine synthase
MQAHGATVHLIDGPREAATEAAQEFVDKNHVFYASHVFNPYFFEGTKTFAYEIWEQLGYRAPDRLFLPVGNGTMYLGAYKGFQELHAAGEIDRMPMINIVQASSCAPIASAYEQNSEEIEEFVAQQTCAEGIAITNPPRGQQILEALNSCRGEVITVTDTEIEAARKDLARAGYFVEPTAAAPFAAYAQSANTPAADNPTTIVPLCGSGLKSVKS